MSTRLTRSGIPMVDSQSLKLVLAASSMEQVFSEYLSNQLTRQGYEAVTPSSLSFLSALDCGENVASNIARALGVSRQMVAKTVKQLCKIGYLEQIDGVGRQKTIIFTPLGEQLISDARRVLADLDHVLFGLIGEQRAKELTEGIHSISTAPEFKSDVEK